MVGLDIAPAGITLRYLTRSAPSARRDRRHPGIGIETRPELIPSSTCQNLSYKSDFLHEHFSQGFTGGPGVKIVKQNIFFLSSRVQSVCIGFQQKPD